MPAPSSEETTAAPLQFASPPTPSRDLEVVLDKYRGFRRPLRYLAIDTAVARPADDGLHPVQLRPICLCHPTGDTRSSFSAPFHPSLSDRGAALQPPVEDQQAREVLTTSCSTSRAFTAHIVLPAEGDGAVLDPGQPGVGDGDTMGVATEIVEH